MHDNLLSLAIAVAEFSLIANATLRSRRRWPLARETIVDQRPSTISVRAEIARNGCH